MRNNVHLLLIDNYDSFTYNLQHLLAVIPGVTLTVKRNDENFIKELETGNYAGVIIGPGPGSPVDDNYFGFNKRVILDFGTQGLPILGVCLGFQGIYHCFGGQLKVARLPMHGKISELQIENNGLILQDVPNGIRVMRYHSIIADLEQAIPDCLERLAYTSASLSQTLNGQELMALEHKEYPIYGVQFHPESFATEYGERIVVNFVKRCLNRH
ncbi:MAG: hypothetical protein BWK79_18585 [Beggiatoa sp. IS2]|nr:MAG: hypothetical protein BWK79_18585 [Beggiatoa sp. IS2]